MHNYWYMACAKREVIKNKNVLQRTIDGEDIAVFHLDSGEIIAFADRCCHRSVPLSTGSVEGNTVVCSYHGWTFDNTGKCIRIPAQGPDERPSKNACVKKYPVKVQNNLVWVFMGEAEEAEKTNPPEVPELNDDRFQIYNYTIEGDLEAANENLIDAYHLDFVHTGSLQKVQGTIVGHDVDFHLKVHDDYLEGWYQRFENKTGLAEWFQSKVFGWGGDKIIHRFRYDYPNLQRVWITGQGPTLLVFQHVTRHDKDRIRFTNILAWNPILANVPGFDRYLVSWGMRWFSTRIVKEDIVAVIAQKRALQTPGAREKQVSTKQDEVSLAFRKMWKNKKREELKSTMQSKDTEPTTDRIKLQEWQSANSVKSDPKPPKKVVTYA